MDGAVEILYRTAPTWLTRSPEAPAQITARLRGSGTEEGFDAIQYHVRGFFWK